ncbi:hypothetical protein [Chitinophaga ginsengisoli]|uniref:Uncharacterized protein n=1 Tax=Chitinophaga ginsengisoli TaxID=363837 RepID=A0A2P8FUR1_9BACT|nr:hypothetical protein [Chitinophaga ginsengisoli]PSL25451.1 hypothetical protein CLV42_113133 [Chitinophaga ginsengisoli]
MAENIEILLEDVLIPEVMVLLSTLNAESKLQYYRTTLDESENLQLPSLLELKQRFESASNSYFYFRFSSFRLLKLQLPEAGIQVHKYDNSYDLSIDFPESHFDKLGISIADLQNSVRILADDLNAKMYCCGYEPVFNLDTRFFTNTELGPLSI